MNLEEMKQKVIELKKAKGFGDNPTEKLLWAFGELGELTDMYKKGESKWYISDKETLTLKKYSSFNEFQHGKAIELIDIIFYILDYASCDLLGIDLDKVFEEKLALNLKRPVRYGLDNKFSG